MAFTDYLDDKLGEGKGISGERLYACPFCNDNHKMKFSVHTDEDEKKDLWQCWKCGSKGNPITFAMKYNGISFQEARDVLEMYVEIDPIEYQQRQEGLTDKEILHLKLMEMNKKKEPEKKELTPPRLPIGYKFLMQNTHNPEAYPFFDYLINKRNISFETIKLHNMAYIPTGYALSSKDTPINLDGHILFFTYGDSGEYLYWNTRSIKPNPSLKSINAIPIGDQFGKGDVVFNLNRAKHLDVVVINEGVFDALTVGDCGVATFGKQVSDRQIELIVKNVKNSARIYVMLDRDAPKQALELTNRIYLEHKNTYCVISPTDEDPNSLGQKRTWEIIRDHSVHASSDKKAFLYL